jgi:hypothetical protein
MFVCLFENINTSSKRLLTKIRHGLLGLKLTQRVIGSPEEAMLMSILIYYLTQNMEAVCRPESSDSLYGTKCGIQNDCILRIQIISSLKRLLILSSPLFQNLRNGLFSYNCQTKFFYVSVPTLLSPTPPSLPPFLPSFMLHIRRSRSPCL